MHKQFLLALIALLLLVGFGTLWLLQKANADIPVAPESPVERCMNLSGALEAPSEGLWGYTIREEDLYRLKAAGFDTIRLPVRWALTFTDNGWQPEQSQLARVDEIISQARSAGLQIILNVHHYNALFDDPDTHEPRLEDLWTYLALHYKNAPQDLIFELINEPHANLTVKRTDALNRKLLAIVRTHHPHRWVLYGTAEWGSLSGMLGSDPLYDPKALIGYHYYAPYEFTHQGAFFANPPPPTGKNWGSVSDQKKIRRHFEDASKFRDRSGMALILGEFGVYEDVPLNLRADWTRFVRHEAEIAGFGWCHWGFATTFKSYDLEQESWIPEILGALIP